jgi:undecaprenyl-diphosphatase
MLAALDTKVFYFINKSLSCRALDSAMPALTFLGSGEFIFVVAMLLVLIFRKNDKAIGGILILAGLTASYYTTNAIKDLVGRPRPFMDLSDVIYQGTATGFSFPSGHATVAFMAAFILSRYFKKPFWLFLLASLVAVSRVYLGVHYPIDVMAGACLGLALGYVLSRFA